MAENFFSSISGFNKGVYKFESKDKETDYSEVDFCEGDFEATFMDGNGNGIGDVANFFDGNGNGEVDFIDGNGNGFYDDDSNGYEAEDSYMQAMINDYMNDYNAAAQADDDIDGFDNEG